MGDKLKALARNTQLPDANSQKIAEEFIAQGQLIGMGFNYEILEKEGAPLAAIVAKLAIPSMSSVRKLVSGAGDTVVGAAKSVGKKMGVKPTAMKDGKFVKGKLGKHRQAKAGGLAAGGTAIAAGAGLRAMKKDKQAADEVAAKEAADLAVKEAADKKAAGSTDAATQVLRYVTSEEEV